MRNFIISTAHTPDTFHAIKLRRMRWVEYVECIGGKEKCIQDFCRETSKKTTRKTYM